MLFHCFPVFNSFLKIPNQGWFSFQFFTLTKMSENDFLNLETFNILSPYSTHNQYYTKLGFFGTY